MKRAMAVLCICVMLTGCFGAEREIERGMALRSKILSGNVCSFDVTVTADYGDKIYVFDMSCSGDAKGDLEFQVDKPESISDIQGKISSSGGNIVFGDTALFFPLMADDQISPVGAPWVLLKTLRSGYITSAAAEAELLHLSIDDSFSDDALHLDVWLDSADIPIRAEILWEGRRILTMDVKDFQIA